MNNLKQLTNRKFGVEIETVGRSTHDVAEALRAVGVNAEAQHYNHRTMDTLWKCIEDGSLRGTNCEIVSPVLQGQEGAATLKLVCDALMALEGCRVNISCGLHVHLDVNDLNAQQIVSIYSRYADYESQIDLLMPRSRRDQNNTYCGSIKRNKNTVTRQKTKSSLGSCTGRYYKVNLQSLNRYGTVEFRQHAGTQSFEKIINWIVTLMVFVETSSNLAGNVRPRTNKNRPYHNVRQAIENAGGTIEWYRRAWFVRLNGHSEYYDNWELDRLYEDTRERSIDLDALTEFLKNGHNLDDDFVADVATRPTTMTRIEDTGWDMGLEEDLKTYWDERQNELG